MREPDFKEWILIILAIIFGTGSGIVLGIYF
jgi:hypothetical protein